jgi:hypothetical protein
MSETSPLKSIFEQKRIASIAASVAAATALAAGLGGYAIHEHRVAKNLAAANAQATAALNTTRNEVSDLTAKVNMLAARNEAPPAPTAPSARAATAGKPAAARRQREDPRFNKLQSQLDAQGREIEQTRSDLASTQGDLTSTRTELTSSIAHTHDELVLLEKKGERNYVEFDIVKSKDFHRAGPFSIRLKKADGKHQFADLELLVDDRNLSQKHVNLYQPVMFSTPGSPQPVEVVINDISKNHIHGYVSAPKYSRSDLALMSNPPSNPAGNGAAIADSGPVQTSDQRPDGTDTRNQPRQKLPKPQP